MRLPVYETHPHTTPLTYTLKLSRTQSLRYTSTRDYEISQQLYTHVREAQ